MVCFRYIIVNTLHKGDTRMMMMMMMMVVVIIIIIIIIIIITITTTTTTTTTTTIIASNLIGQICVLIYSFPEHLALDMTCQKMKAYHSNTLHMVQHVQKWR